MNEMLQNCAVTLTEAGFSICHTELPADHKGHALETLAFEDATVLGFVVAYESAAELIASWKSDGNLVAMRYRDTLQAARQKAWNTYLVLIARGPANFTEALMLGQIEENLEAMRKITKAGVTGLSATHQALLPLLPFRAMPSLDPIDMRKEIRSRTTELDDQLVAAFLSGADEAVVMQLLEDQA